jgi:GTP-binding protein HflX
MGTFVGCDSRKRAIVAAVQLPTVSDVEFDASVTELGQLAKTLGFEVVATFTQRRSSFDRVAYLGVGKRQEMRRFVRNESSTGQDAGEGDTGDPEDADGDIAARDAGSDDGHGEDESDPGSWRAEVLLVDHEISPSQARNLEKEVGCEVMDRTMVILEIFHRHASSRAARAQV